MAVPTDAPLRFPDERDRKRGPRVARMFDRIAPTYDLLNRLLSGRRDVRWRAKAVERLALTGGEEALDVCCGTGDLALAVLEGGAGRVTGTDFAPRMIARARRKVGDRIRLQVADTLRLPFANASHDLVSIGFGLRNLADLDAGLLEMRRVLRPGGRLLVLEFSRPSNPLFRVIYHTYFMVVLPVIGNLISGTTDNAYAYLPRSVLSFPGPEALAARMRGAGFTRVDVMPLDAGIACVHIAKR